MITIILLAVLVIAVLIGAVSGLIKGYAKTSFWGGVVFLTLLLERAIGAGVKKDSGSFAIVMFIATVVLIVIFSIAFKLLRAAMNKRIKSRRTLTEYELHDSLEDLDTRILCAVDDNDKYAYKELTKERKRLIKSSSGCGALNRILGIFPGAFNGFFGAFIFVSIAVFFVEFTQISFLANSFADFISSDLWVMMLGGAAMDTIVIALLAVVIKSGYKNGLSSVLCPLLIIGLVAASGFASFKLASSESMAQVASSLENGLLAKLPDVLAAFRHILAVIIITAIFFLLSLIIVIIVGIFLPKLVNALSKNKVFAAVDGAFGALLSAVFVIGLLIVFGGIANTLCDLSFMERVNAYMNSSFVADGAYFANPLASTFAKLPIRSWFGDAAN